MLKKFLTKIWVEAQDDNVENILSLLKKNPKAKVLDIGCGGGHLTLLYKKKIGCTQITGVDGVKEKIKVAKKNGINALCFNLEEKWPLRDNEFDVIISNQVIEHILDIDNFISESYRVLKKGGYSITSTENLSSWHNIFALTLGMQDFSHHLIKKKHVGNPFALHANEETCSWKGADGVDEKAFPHIKIPTFISLRKMFEAFNFKYVQGKGSGYYPLFGFLSRFASQNDPYHSHFIVIKVKK